MARLTQESQHLQLIENMKRDPPPERQTYLAIQANDATWLRQILTSYPQLFGCDRKRALEYDLKHAVEVDSPSIIDVLVEFGADVNAPINSVDPEGVIEETCLVRIKLNAARRLLEHGAKINFDTPDGIRCRTLIFAIAKGSLEMVKLLVQYGAAFNSPERGLTALDHAVSRGQNEIADYLRSIGGKTAEEMGWIPPPPPPESELSEVMDSYFEAEYLTKLGTIHGLLDSDPVIDIHLFDEGVKIILHTQGMAMRPIPTDSGQEELRFVEIEMALPQGWPIGDEMLKTDEAAWPVQWLRRLAYHPHQDEQPIGKLFFYPNGSPPKPFANTTEMCFWMLMLSNKPPVYVSEEKQIMIYIAVPLYKEEYELVQRHGLGELGRRFDENKIYPHQMFFRKNVGME